MSLHKVVLWACLVAAATVTAAQTPAPPASRQSLQALVQELQTSATLPAVGGALFRSDGTPEVAVSGLRKLGADAPVTVDDLWHIGSISKSFTSLLVARFVERGDLSWTSTLKELVGDRAGAFGGVTIEHLLAHRAGIPANATPMILGPAVKGNPPLTEVRRRVLDETLKGQPSAAPGVGFLYSNLGYVIVASILEERTGKLWEDLVRAEVIEPLGLRSAGMGAPGVPNDLTQPRGHRNGTTPAEPGPMTDNPPYMGPAGRLHMTLTDLARWGQVHLRGERGQNGLVRADTFRHLHRPQAGGDYALGWVSQQTSDRRVVWHNGSNTMWYAIVLFDPAADRGVVLVTNGGIGAAKALDAAARRALVVN